ncbi:MAG: alpha/beta hydrolase [Lachnospiraceae bacterium]|nr:alpha/beta hydrolase [Lachnospiraceae bacterium]
MNEDIKLSHRGKIIRDLVALFNKNEMLRNKFSATGENPVPEKEYKYSDIYQVEYVDLENCKAEYIKPKESPSKWIIIQLHGGGYVGGLKNSYRNLAGLYSEMGQGAAVLSLDYRLAPDHVFPAALEDAFAGYEWAIARGYSEEEIILAGDSAGGGLAMGLCHYLKDNGKTRPRAIIAMSPWADLTGSGPSYKDNVVIDPVFGSRPEVVVGSTYIGEDSAENPYISPMFGDFAGFPKMLIQVGTDEMLLSDSQTVRDKALTAGVEVDYTEYQGMFHVFQMAGKLMPESKQAWEQIKEFIDEL